jgi:hypothetical protein
VRSSTSSSDERLPRGGWGRTWSLAALLVVLPLAGWEGFLRARGHYGQVHANNESWILQLHKLRRGGEARTETAVLGTSRIQAALDPGVWREVMGGGTAVNLSRSGTSSVSILEYIADSTRFAGITLFELMPFYVFNADSNRVERGDELLARYETDRVSPARLSEAWLQVHLVRHVAFRSPQLLPPLLPRELAAGRFPAPGSLHLRPDRFGPVNQRQFLGKRAWDARRGFTDLTYRAVQTGGRAANPAEYEEIAGRLDRAAATIMARGGRVVFLYMGACGGRLEIEERRFPRHVYWDPFVARTRAATLTTLDYAELKDFDCWDGSHIEELDAPVFTRRLAEIVKRRIPL